MKKLLMICACLIMTALCANAQTIADNDSTTQEVYCCIVGTEQFMSNKVSITIDYGQETSFFTSGYDTKIVDENGKKIKFNSMIDASNYLASMGWKLVNAFPASSKQGTCYHFVFKKQIKKGDIGKININTRQTVKRNKQPDPDDMYN